MVLQNGWDLDFDGHELLNEVAKFDRDETHSFARNWFRDIESTPREQMTHSVRHAVGVHLYQRKSGASRDVVTSVMPSGVGVYHKGCAIF
jgi:hypothetical protein